MANLLPTEKKILAVSMLCENSSIRAIERMTGIHRDTIMRLGVRMGEGCKGILDSRLRGLNCQRIEVDEIWGFIGMKEKTAKRKNLNEFFGDIWTWIALDAETKLVPTFAIGDRSGAMADSFIFDLSQRINGRVQITSDALAAYRGAIENAFGEQADYATLIKTYSEGEPTQQRRYSPPTVTGIRKKVIQGNPDASLISTSYVEKQNHTVRMHVRRLSRLTNAFSKKRENFEAAIALHFAYYNFVKNHGTMKTTPAVAAGVENRNWKVAELVEMVEG